MTAPDASAGSVQRTLSWILLLGFLFILGIARGAYAAQEEEPSGTFRLVAALGLLALLWFWLEAQLEPYRPRLVMDMGLLLLFCWFAVVPYYMWHYERWRGVLKVSMLGVAYLLSWLVAVVVSVVLS